MAFTPVQKLSITSGAAMLLLAIVGLVAYLSTSDLVDAQAAAAHTNDVIARLYRVQVRTMAAREAADRYAVAADSEALTALNAAQSDVEYALDTLRTGSEDHPAQRRYLDSLGPVVSQHFRDMRQVVLIRDRVGRDSAARLATADRGHSSLTRLLGDMRTEEVRVLGERTRVMAESARTSRAFIVGGSLLALVLALVAVQPLRPAVERRLTERLSRTMNAITDDDLKGG